MYSTKVYHPGSYATGTGIKIPFLFEKEKFKDPARTLRLFPQMNMILNQEFLTQPPQCPATRESSS